MNASTKTTVGKECRRAEVFDLHTHLFPPSFGTYASAGIDELLTYHYLSSEYIATTRTDPRYFFSSPKRDQAQKIWEGLFVERTPFSEAAQGVLAVLSSFGIKVHDSYDKVRRAFPDFNESGHTERVLKMAGVRAVVMTNNPTDADEWQLFERDDWDRDLFRAAIRLDDLLLKTPEPRVAPGLERSALRAKPESLAEHIERWRRESDPCYVALTPSYEQLATLPTDPIIQRGLLPYLASASLPLALMIGPRRALNPALGSGGDGITAGSLAPLEQLLSEHPDNLFLATTLDSGSQQQLCVLARVFSNLRVFGHWWYMNNESLIRENLALRLELLGSNFIAQHSDARVLEQLIYKWSAFRDLLADGLASRYQKARLPAARLSSSIIRRDVDWLLRGHAESICRPRQGAA